MVRIPAFHAGGPGSIPGVGAYLLPADKTSLIDANETQTYESSLTEMAIKSSISRKCFTPELRCNKNPSRLVDDPSPGTSNMAPEKAESVLLR